MSYILDALRRADAERERGEVPGLQSQQHAMLDDDDAAPKSRPLVWVIVALVLALAAAIAWNFLGGEPPRPPPSATATPPTPPMAPPTASPAAPPLVVASPLPPVVAASTAAARASASAPPATVAEVRKPAPSRVAAAPAATAPASAGIGAGAMRAAADSRVYPLAELPDSIRRDLPRLAFGGSSYSGSASSRMVILNGQVFHEGDVVAPGLTLRQIKPKAAVLSFRDYRFEMSY